MSYCVIDYYSLLNHKTTIQTTIQAFQPLSKSQKPLSKPLSKIQTTIFKNHYRPININNPPP